MRLLLFFFFDNSINSIKEPCTRSA